MSEFELVFDDEVEKAPVNSSERLALEFDDNQPDLAKIRAKDIMQSNNPLNSYALVAKHYLDSGVYNIPDRVLKSATNLSVNMVKSGYQNRKLIGDYIANLPKATIGAGMRAAEWSKEMYNQINRKLENEKQSGVEEGDSFIEALPEFAKGAANEVAVTTPKMLSDTFYWLGNNMKDPFSQETNGMSEGLINLSNVLQDVSDYMGDIDILKSKAAPTATGDLSWGQILNVGGHGVGQAMNMVMIGKTIGIKPAYGLYAVAGGAEEFRESFDKEGDLGKANTIAGLNAASTYLIDKWLDPLPENIEKGIKLTRKQIAAEIAKSSTKEPAAEVLQQIYAENLTRKIGIDPTQDLYEGAIESAIGALFGGVVMGSASGISSYRSDKAYNDAVSKAKELGATVAEIDQFKRATDAKLQAHIEDFSTVFQGIADENLKNIDDFVKKYGDTEETRKKLQTKADLEEVYNMVNKALIDAGVNADVANADAKVWQGIALWGSEETGLSPLEYLKKNAPKVEKARFAEFQKRFADKVSKTDSTELEILQQDIARLKKGVSRKTDKGLRLSQFIKQKGGIKDDRGDIKSMGASVGLLNKNGISLDEATRMAWDAGYIQGTERPEINQLLDLLSDDLGNRPVYAFDDQFNGNDRQYYLELERALDEAGADINKDSIETIKKKLDDYSLRINKEPELPAYNPELDDFIPFQESLSLAKENARLDDIYPAYEGETITINGKERTVYNSNGDRIAKSKEALENFYKWFGDSKVVDGQGRPLVVYHGTDFYFNEFRMSGGIDFPDAAYFSSNKNIAKTYTNKKNIMKLYLKMENPYITDAEGQSYNKFYDSLVSDMDWAVRNNYDGVIIRRIRDDWGQRGKGGKIGDTYAVFEPNQIKSTENRGTYSESENDIYYQFAGENAQTAALDELDRAKQLEADGVDNEEIRQQTGWFKGVDGKWRFEISDKDATINRQVLNDIGSIENLRAERDQLLDDIETFKKEREKNNDAYPDGYLDELISQRYDKIEKIDYDIDHGYVSSAKTTLGELLNHDKLYDAYPSLRYMPVTMRTSDDLSGGAYSRKDNTIYLDSRLSDDEIKSILMHEIQHVIQEKENFARGGNTQFAKDYKKIIEKKASAEFMDLLDKKMKEGLERELKEYNLNKKAIVEILDAYSDYTKKFFDTDAENEEIIKAEKKYYETLEKHNISSDILENAMNNLRDQGIWKEAENEVKSKNKLSDADAYEIYRAFFGEVEARNTQARMDLTEEERRDKTPESTQDIANADALIVMPDGTAMAYKPDIVKIEIKGDEFGEYDGNDKKYIKKAKNWYKENLYNKPAFSPVIGKVYFFNRQFSETKDKNIKNIENLKYLPAVRMIIEQSTNVEEETPFHARKDDIVKFYRITEPVSLGGKVNNVSVLVAEDKRGNKYYNLDVIDEKSPQNISEERENEGIKTDNSVNINISPSAQNVNRSLYQDAQSKQPPKGAFRENLDSNGVIYLFEKADASTFMHETAHFFRKELHSFNTARSKEMLKKLSEWENTEFDKRYKVRQDLYGVVVTDRVGNIVYGEQRPFDSVERAREYARNELFARGFEQYLREGKAPNSYLKQAFRSFWNWLKHLYTVAQDLNVDLNDDVRKIYGDILGGQNLDFYLSAPIDEVMEQRVKQNEDRQQKNDAIINDAVQDMKAETYGDVWKYERHNLKQAFKSIKRIRTQEKQETKKAGGDLLDVLITPIDTRLNRINPKLKNRLVNYDARLGIKLNNYYRQIKPFMEIWQTFNREDAVAFDLALKNGYMKKQLEIVNKYDAYDEFVQVKNVLTNIFDSARDVGIELGYMPDYFPRQVKDANAFLAYLEGNNAFSPLRRQLDNWIEEQRKENIEPTIDEKVDFINRYMMGFRRPEGIKPLPGNVKDRMIDIIDKDMNKFYKPSTDALISYIEGMNTAIEQRRLFGKDNKNVANTIGAWVEELMERGEITPEQDEEVKKIFLARFNQKGVSNKWISGLRDASYIYTMGGINSAITQFDDIFMNIYENGVFDSAKELFADNIEGLSRQDLGLESIGQEWSEKSLTSELVNQTFKLTGLDKIDALMKTKYTNLTYKKFRKMAEENPEALRARIEPIMEELTPKVMEDLKNDRITEDVQVLMFNSLSEFQPISLSQMPEGYLRSGNMRMMYMLKTFALKRIDTFRRKCLDEYRKGNKKQALQNLFRLSLIMMLCGATKDAIIDMLYGRPIDMSDIVVNNMLGLVGMSKYSLYKARDDGVDGFLFSLVVPPVKPLYTDLLRDLPKVWSGKKKLKDLEAWKGVPLVGRFYYWWLGGGRTKIEKKTKKKLK